MSKNLTKRADDYSKWYNELVVKADLAENSAVRGCMVIKPYGYAIWEKMQAQLDKMFKETGHSNAYFPLFVPKSMFEAEEKNAEGFAKECAVVTHYRLKNDEERPGKLMVDPNAKLEEELIVRPTSEAIIWSTYKNWIQSYRDLPLLINQWANVVRWEMRTRLFLRTAEFLWQEGHTAHATKQEALDETVQMMNVYANFVENFMAIPVVKGVKTANERFAGAEETFCIEALMQDGKALQAGTSHFLGQNFANAFDVKFTSSEGKQEYVWGTSWGVSTRLMGALIMTHSDDNGLVLPPNLAPIQVVIVPIFKSDEELEKITAAADDLSNSLRKLGLSVKFDNRTTQKPGFKFAEWELKGVPVRVAIGPKDLENGTFEIARRDTLSKQVVTKEDVVSFIQSLMEEIQTEMFTKALSFRNAHITEVNTFDEFKDILENKGGFVSAHWDGTPETEEKIKELTKATIRCIPLERKEENGICIFSGNPSNGRVLFAKAY
ncbi:proline--tRNA ligase [Flavobacterium columnare]|uniref:Proline--tRNA ligase n=1 Tax=Flavobacterium columnare (strain ATCC 49512 / CIP 103533 / TG 44/87) TaxID=1041826 RepID=G8X660_FLACA|nr:proline--tRNA ligase [Flavobacterium columnare]AEW86290.1 prolyl-tRNA synthetase [Flavobacterium columnare ATCC 49512]PDS23941.1 proline--tRNA ligase [Flavobacterium columnare] [Flavobacterium columnare NBRC 100251 = ATCC 23463]QOG90366.1 proline--tRNA ligase [Flavobacterium columnare]QOG93022.1 proline--tRNA ligase [Flavobacterium columnare]QOG95687.1 proline--tRNA ligase [Flavobacterium columnare]